LFSFRDINSGYRTEAIHHSYSTCKIGAAYYAIKVNDEISENAAKEIMNHVALLKNVIV
jgi:uncharacterized protein (DUF427 family)